MALLLEPQRVSRTSLRQTSRAVLLGLALLSVGASAEEAAPPSVTLEEAIQRALEVSPQVIQAHGEIRAARAAQRSAFGAYLPSASVSGNAGLSSAERFSPDLGTTVSAASSSLRAGVNASWRIFTGFQRRAQRQQADAQSEVATAGIALTRADVIFNVQTVFYDGLRASSLADVARSRMKRAEEGLTAAQKRSAVGSATKSDVLRAELEVNEAQQALLQARTEGEIASYNLGRLIGLEGPATAVGGTEPTFAAVDEKSVVNELLAESPDVRSANASLLSAQAGINAAQSRYYPTLSLSTGADWFNSPFGLSGGRTGWSVGLGLSWSLFDGFAREETVERAEIQETNAAAVLADTSRAVRTAAAQSLGQIRLARERIALAEKAVSVAMEDLRVQQERYTLGVTTILELLTSQQAVVQAETDRINARFDHQLAHAQLESLRGNAP